MNPEYIKTAIINDQRQRNVSLDDAADELVRGLGLTDRSPVDAVVSAMREESRRLQSLDIPQGVHAEVYREVLTDDAKETQWYLGPRDSDRYWGYLRGQIEGTGLASVLPEIDVASSKVVAHFADPGIRRLKKKGLVLGYVQSGKTANYAAVMAKAADAGYRLCIVMSGMHNNLRRQTQVRLNRDLGVGNWNALTTEDRDFGEVLHGQALLQNPQARTIAVVKKNPMRLRRLRDWLQEIDPAVRAQAPILLLDDEADQATPNSLAAKQEMSKINKLIREIWSEIPTGSYVGYTATPFANIFMDPNDETEMYPSDFILDLPRSGEYFGAERIFGRQSVEDADDPEPGLDMVRMISVAETTRLRPPSSSQDRASFDPDVPTSLGDAVVWFVIATCIRRLRGQIDHSSMLVHTTSYVAPHFAMQGRLENMIFKLRRQLEDGDLSTFRKSFDEEAARVPGVAQAGVPAWRDVTSVLVDVLDEIRVVVDNGRSTDRLDYGRLNENGRPITETVIAVGGGTLSRGLTLEGLVVSYFTRTSNTYDTLLQMGRWFGYRPGYEDLPRIWMTDDLAEDFQFLATVEEEVRVEIRRLTAMGGITPSQMGLRVRAHPGRLSITDPKKMHHARLVQVSFSGQRHQTFLLHETDSSALRANIAAARRLADSCQASSVRGLQGRARRQFNGVSVEAVLEFVQSYKFHPDQGLRADHIADWIDRHARTAKWNVVFLGTEKDHTVDGRLVELGEVDLGFEASLPLVNRAPLRDPSSTRANIKALLSVQDWVADQDRTEVSRRRAAGATFPEIRRAMASDVGLLIIYGVSNHSKPLRGVSRRVMNAEFPLIGVGIVFPELAEEGRASEGDFISVQPSWNARVDEEVEELLDDDEKSNTVDAVDLMRGGS